ncbi:BspA family leucine-rich repeat surface protein, partial [Rhizobium leguminosarum]
NNVTTMSEMFFGCSSLVSVPDLDTSKVTSVSSMFRSCSSLKDGRVRLIRPTRTKPSNRTNMIINSGLTREPFFLPDGTPIN